MFILFCKSTGQIQQIITASADQVPDWGKDYGVIESDFCNPDGYVQDGVPTPLPPQPAYWYQFDYETKQWVDTRTLQEAKDQQWEVIKRARSAAELGGFTWDGSVFDSDPISQGRIQGAIQLANLSPGFEITWTLANNTTRVLNQADLAAVGVAMGVHVSSLHAKAHLLRERINAANTKEEVSAVVADF